MLKNKILIFMTFEFGNSSNQAPCWMLGISLNRNDDVHRLANQTHGFWDIRFHRQITAALNGGNGSIGMDRGDATGTAGVPGFE